MTTVSWLLLILAAHLLGILVGMRLAVMVKREHEDEERDRAEWRDKTFNEEDLR